MDKNKIITNFARVFLFLLFIGLLSWILAIVIMNYSNAVVTEACEKQNFTGVVGEPGFEIQCTAFLDEDGLVNNECKRIEK